MSILYSKDIVAILGTFLNKVTLIN